nr:MarR family winged helix-turn-helix transcriptional regulator [Pacificimonas pallii]
MRPLGDPGSTQFEVKYYPFYLLNRAVGRYNTVIEMELRKIGLDIPGWRVLMILGEQSPRPIAQVAKTAVINISTMTRIVERMVASELIETVPCGKDRRVRQLALTGSGHEKLAAARKLAEPVYRKLVDGFSASEFADLIDYLNRLYTRLD